MGLSLQACNLKNSTKYINEKTHIPLGTLPESYKVIHNLNFQLKVEKCLESAATKRCRLYCFTDGNLSLQGAEKLRSKVTTMISKSPQSGKRRNSRVSSLPLERRFLYVNLPKHHTPGGL